MLENEKIMRKIEERKLKDLDFIKKLTIINFLLITVLGFMNFNAAQQAETKVDLRYYNLKESNALTHNIWIDEFTGKKYKSKSDYDTAQSTKVFEKRTFWQKYFKTLSK